MRPRAEGGPGALADERPHAPRPVRAWVLALAAVAVVIGVYARALAASFVWDDRALVFEDPAVAHLASPLRYLFTPFWASGPELRAAREFYRPLVTFSFAVDHAVHGANASGYHLTNLVFHLLACVLVFALLRRGGSAGPFAFLFTVAWGLLPRLAESVAWIAGRTDVIASVFAFAALLVWRDEVEAARRRWGAAGLLLLGILAKEVAVAAWVGLAVRCLVLRRPRGEVVRSAAPLGAILLAYVPLRVSALRGAPPTAFPHLGLRRVPLVLEAIGRYVWMIVDPWQPRMQIGVVEGARDAASTALGGATLLAVVVVAAWWWRRRRAGTDPSVAVDPALATYLATAATGIGLVLHVFPLPMNVVAADRFLYLPTAALLLAVAPSIEAWAASGKRWIVPAAIAASLVPSAYARVLDWSDEARLWWTAVRHSPPNNGLAHNQLGNVYFRAGAYEEALREYRLSLEGDERIDLAPLRTYAQRGNIANALAKLGRYDEGLKWREKLVADRPEAPRVHLDLAGDLLRLLNFAAAREEIGVALQLLPDYPEAAEARTRVDELEREAPAALVPASPPDPKQVLARARFFTKLGRRPEAIAAWLDALAHAPLGAEETFEAAVYLAREAPPDVALDPVRRAVAQRNDPEGDAIATTFADRLASLAALKAAETER